MSIAIRFLRRRNLGNFEHTELEITDSVEKKEDLKSSIDGIMATVKDALYETGVFRGLGTPGQDKVVINDQTKVNKTPAANTTAVKNPPKTETTEKVDTAVKETETKAEAPSTETKPQDTKVEAPKEEVKKEEAKKEVKKETVTKVKATKVTAYDRELDAHKNNLGVFLTGAFPTWRKPNNLKKAGAASRVLQGSEFLDADGNILQSFKDAFSKYMVDLE